MWAGLNEELVSPAVERLKGLGTVYVVNEDAAVGTTVERDAERLEALLTSSIPELGRIAMNLGSARGRQKHAPA